MSLLDMRYKLYGLLLSSSLARVYIGGIYIEIRSIHNKLAENVFNKKEYVRFKLFNNKL